jgi:eukaryotic-like serine/threonine-protein kinase
LCNLVTLPVPDAGVGARGGGQTGSVEQAEAARPVPPPRILGGRYRLVERLGVGGMSVVWRAYDEVLSRPVAVKVLAGRFAADPDCRDRIRAEAQAAAALSHPHITSVYDYGESVTDDDICVPYVVMELLHGTSLSQRLRAGALPWRSAVRIGAEVAAALAAAHSRGLVHRDVKPANVMLTASGAKVVDFGIAAVVGDAADAQPDAVVLGTPAYLAPERLDGAPAQPATDVYALGLLLYRMITGGPPWQAETTTQMLDAHAHAEPRRLPVLNGLPPAVSELCRRCLAKAPEDRPTSREVARVLAEAAGVSVPLTGGRPAAAPYGFGTQRAGRIRTAFAVLMGAAPEDVEAETAIVPRSGYAPRPRSYRRRHRLLPLAGLAGTLAGAVLLLVFWADLGADGQTGRAVAAGGSPSPTGTPASCTVLYQVRTDTAGAFLVDVTLQNLGPSPVSGWRLAFTFPGDQVITKAATVQVRQQKESVVVTPGATNSNLPPGAQAPFAFAATYRLANPMPTGFTLDGRPCRYTLVGATGQVVTGGPPLDGSGGDAAGVGDSSPAPALPPLAPPPPTAGAASPTPPAGATGTSGGTTTAPAPSGSAETSAYPGGSRRPSPTRR